MKYMLAVGIAVVLTGCGGGSKGACLTFDSGTKICGSKAVSWCNYNADKLGAEGAVSCDLIKLDE